MQRIRRLAAVVGVTAMAGAFVAGPASADNVEAYLGNAAARGLHISLAHPLEDGKVVEATLGSAEAQVDSTIKAKAMGAGQLLPDLLSTVREAEATAQDTVDDPAAGCALAEPGLVSDYLKFGLACGDAVAQIKNGLPSAASEGSIAGLSLEADNVVTQLLKLDTTLIGDTLADVLGTVCDTVGETCPATTTVQDLVQTVLKTKTLDVSVGKSTSTVVADGSKVTSSADASGAVIKLLPLPQVNGLPSSEPIATIEIGAAKATAVYDRVAGTAAEPTFDPAVVRVTLNSAVIDALDLPAAAKPPTTFEVRPNTDEVILDEVSPLLASRIVVGSGRKVTRNGVQGAEADAVKLHLLMGLGESSPGALDGGITIELAHAEAFAAGTPAQVTPVDEQPRGGGDPPLTAKELPRTGGTPWIPLAGAGVLAIAMLVRRATVRASAG